MKKQFAALARVSSREQEREGFSLEVQEEALHRYAAAQRGEIIKFFKIAETASKRDERKAFKELIAYAKAHARELAGLLFFKVDRAARNLFDYVELERLETEHGVPVVYVSQPTENTPAGRMMRRTLANMAAFYTEQQSLDVRDGHARRVKSGLFVAAAPYGYLNVRRGGRSLIEVSPVEGRNVARAFDLYAYHNHTIDSLTARLTSEGLAYTDVCPRWTRSKVHTILRYRAYIGEVSYQGQWHPGSHPPLVDVSTFRRVQVLLGEATYQSHELTYGGERVTCGHCGRPITGELKTKQTKTGPKQYAYYRCTGYTAPGHPRVRVNEAALDHQILDIFARLKIPDEQTREWFRTVLRARLRHDQSQTQQRTTELNRQLSLLRNQQDQLLNLRLLEEVDESTFARKNVELRDRIADLSVQLQGCDRGCDERTDLIEKTFELSQTLQERWLTADYRAKRELLDIVCLNFRLDGATLVTEMRKPFNALAEGLPVLSSRGDRI